MLLANHPSGEAGTRQHYLTESTEQDCQKIADSICTGSKMVLLSSWEVLPLTVEKLAYFLLTFSHIT